MNTKIILFLDNTYPEPYQSSTLITQGIGGTESSVIKTATILSKKYQVFVAQKNRKEITVESSRLSFIPKSKIIKLQPDFIVVLRKYPVLKEMFQLFPKARLFLWLHTYKNNEYAVKKRGLSRLNVTIICNSKTHQLHISRLLNTNLLSRIINPFIKHIAIKYCYNPIDRPKIYPAKRNNNKLLFLSSPNKGLDQVLSCFKQVKQFMPELKLYIANPGYKKDDLAVVNKDIKILGSLPHSQMMKHVQNSLCVFYPQSSFAETFGLIYAEANAYGTAVLAHAIGSAREILDDNNVLIDVTDPNAVIKKLKQWQDSYPDIKYNESFSNENILIQWNTVL